MCSITLGLSVLLIILNQLRLAPVQVISIRPGYVANIGIAVLVIQSVDADIFLAYIFYEPSDLKQP